MATSKAEIQRRIDQLNLGGPRSDSAAEANRQSVLTNLRSQLTSTAGVTVDVKVGDSLELVSPKGRKTLVVSGSDRESKLLGRGFTATGVTGREKSLEDTTRLPDREDPEDPGLAGTGVTLQDLVTASRSAVDEEDVRRQVESERAPGRARIERTLGRGITEAKIEGAEEERALEGQLGTRRRFSSSASAFIKFNDEQNNKQISRLEDSLQNALDGFDFQSAQLIRTEITRRNNEARQRFGDMLKLIDFAEKQNRVDEDVVAAERDGVIAALFSEGVTDIAEIQSALTDAGFTDTRLSDVDKVINLLEVEGEDLSGTSSDLRTFAFLNPDIERGTPEFRTEFNRFIAQQASLKRKPVVTEDEEITGIEIPDFDTFVDEFMQTPEGQQVISQLESQRGASIPLEERRRLVSEEVRGLFDRAVEEAKNVVTGPKFSQSQLIKLEGAGLLNAPREEQIAFLTEDSDDGETGEDRNLTEEEFLVFLRTGELPPGKEF